ncbi:MAG TPA: hypothetical protein VGF55_00880 [Gemmataceae bacterium]|jgi:hypothetical protein
MTTPDWLTRHESSLRQAPDGHTWLVYFDGAPHYKLKPAPAAGRHTCAIEQTENGKRIDKGETYPTADDALRGGLEGLRSHLGW